MGHRVSGKKLIKNQEGFSLVELLIAVALLGLIAATFLHVFIYSTNANITARKLVDEGYIAQTCMEEIYSLSQGKDMVGLKDTLVLPPEPYVYVGALGNVHIFTKEIDQRYVKIMITEEAFLTTNNKLTKVKIEVCEDASHTKLLASVQDIIKLK